MGNIIPCTPGLVFKKIPGDRFITMRMRKAALPFFNIHLLKPFSHHLLLLNNRRSMPGREYSFRYYGAFIIRVLCRNKKAGFYIYIYRVNLY